jgi:hypothetical protein
MASSREARKSMSVNIRSMTWMFGVAGTVDLRMIYFIM